MIRRFAALLSLAALTTVASADDSNACESNLTVADLPAAMGGDLRIQPVHSPTGFRGWRVYGTDTSTQLTAHGIGQGSLITQVCGVAAREIESGGGRICCSVDASREFEVRFQVADQERTVLIIRPLTP